MSLFIQNIGCVMGWFILYIRFEFAGSYFVSDFRKAGSYSIQCQFVMCWLILYISYVVCGFTQYIGYVMCQLNSIQVLVL